MTTVSDPANNVRHLRAYRIALDPTGAQLDALGRHAGAARWGYNLAHSAKLTAREVWEQRVAALVEAGSEHDAARRAVKVPIPRAPLIDKARVRVKGTDRQGRPQAPRWEDAWRVLTEGGQDEGVATAILTRWAEHCSDATLGIQPWAPEVPSSVIQCAEKNADAAWKAWFDGLTGKRAGRAPGFPRFKRRGKSTDSFYLVNTEVGVATPRRLRLGGVLGEVRTAENTRRLRRALERRNGRIMGVTVSRSGHRWFAAVQVEEDLRARPTSWRQQAAGTVGVDLGVKVAAALSTGEIVENPRTKRSHARTLGAAARRMARTEKGSKRRTRAARRLGRLNALEAARRATFVHRLTKRLTTEWAAVAIEDLNVAGMTRSARGTKDAPGKRVRQKSGLNREILDVSPGEIRRQLQYKAPWYGSILLVCDRWEPTSKRCSCCGTVKPKLSLAERVYHCAECGATMDRDVNAARNIGRMAVAPDVGETQNARGGSVRPPRPRSGRHDPLKREGPAASARSPGGSDAAAIPLRA